MLNMMRENAFPKLSDRPFCGVFEKCFSCRNGRSSSCPAGNFELSVLITRNASTPAARFQPFLTKIEKKKSAGPSTRPHYKLQGKSQPLPHEGNRKHRRKWQETQSTHTHSLALGQANFGKPMQAVFQAWGQYHSADQRHESPSVRAACLRV